MSYTKKPGLGALAVYVVVAMALAALINGLIVFSDAAEWTESLKKPVFALTGLQIGLMWEFLFACMATSFWLIRRTPPLPDRRAASTALAAMFLIVLAFPFYAILPPEPSQQLCGDCRIGLHRVDCRAGRVAQQQAGWHRIASFSPVAQLCLGDRTSGALPQSAPGAARLSLLPVARLDRWIRPPTSLGLLSTFPTTSPSSRDPRSRPVARVLSHRSPLEQTLSPSACPRTQTPRYHA